MGIFSYLRGEQILSVSLPDPSTTVFGDVRWGLPEEIFSPAYWHTQYLFRAGEVFQRNHRLGDTFSEEVAACVLGGHGIPAEVGLAAYERVKSRGLIRESVSVQEIEAALYEPLYLDGRKIRYRFRSQKARYLSEILQALGSLDYDRLTSLQVRERLMQLPGIGPKTASWIVRNWFGTHEVAILDIHIIRACTIMRLFSDTDKVERHYLSMEDRFLRLAHAINVPAGDLDALMWALMRETPMLVARMLNAPKAQVRDRQSHRATQVLLPLA